MAARGAVRQQLPQRSKRLVELLVSHRFDAASSFISFGTSIAQTFKYVAGDSRRTRFNTSGPCCCQSSARSSRKRLLNARRVASGVPPGFPNPRDATGAETAQAEPASRVARTEGYAT